MIEVTFRPIDVWPGDRTRHPDQAPFSAVWSKTLRLLSDELEHLRAKHVVVQLALPESAIRLDGWPKADARPDHPGVILAFDSQHGPLKYATDRFSGGRWRSGGETLPGWQCNLRAIALGLEALRKVDRYGITKRGEQYTGWKALGGGIAVGPTMSLEDAARLLIAGAGSVNTVREVLEHEFVRNEIYRMAAKKLHPDVGGTTEDFQRLQEAKQLLDQVA